MRIAERAEGLTPFALALRLTLLEVLLRPAAAWPLRTAMLVLAGLALVHERVLLARGTWLLLAALTGLRLVVDWPLADNHAYLLAYWCLAVALAAGVPDAQGNLAFSARWLCGLAFAFAVLWKAFLSPDFLDGRFFRLTLIQDPRFADVALLLGGLSPEDLRENREYLEPLPEGAELLDARVLVEPPAFRRLATALTWGGLTLEAIAALVFLLPVPPALRHAALLLFCVTTYAFAPVAGFGCLLLVLGLAQTNPSEARTRALYVVAFFLVLTYAEAPWAGLLRFGPEFGARNRTQGYTFLVSIGWEAKSLMKMPSHPQRPVARAPDSGGVRGKAPMAGWSEVLNGKWSIPRRNPFSETQWQRDRNEPQLIAELGARTFAVDVLACLECRRCIT